MESGSTWAAWQSLLANCSIASSFMGGSAHVAVGVELGPSLSSRLQTSVPDSAQTHVGLPDGSASAQAATTQPNKNVRVVYPGPLDN